MKIYTYVLLIALLFKVFTLAAFQNPTFQPITTNNGLSQNSVTSIAQDSFGFLWIATQDGLNRYDGTNFKRYDAYFNDITQADFSRLGKVLVGDQNRIWTITSNDNISYLNTENDSIYLATTLKDASCITQKSRNEYWIGSFTKGLFLLQLIEDVWKISPMLPDIGIYQILENEGELLLATDRGAFSYNALTQQYHSISSTLEKYHISKIIPRSDGSILIGTFSNGLFIKDKNDGLSQVIEIPEHLRIQDVLEDHRGAIWIASYNDGVYILKDNATQHIYHAPPNQNSLNYNDILSIYEDAQENIWLGTDGGGLSFYNTNRKPINKISQSDIPLGMAVDVSRAISTDSQGNIWIGTSGKGLTTYNPHTNEAQHFAQGRPAPFTISSNRIVSLCHDQNDHLWIGTQEGGLLSYDPISKLISRVNREIPAVTIWNILIQDEEHIWLCTRNNGLILYNTRLGTWQQFLAPERHSLRVMVPAKNQGEYYIGTDNGSLLSFDEGSGQFRAVPLSTTTGGIKSLHLETESLWIGTQKEGILIYNFTDQSLKQINTTNGLPNNVVYALMNQDEKFIWASTNQGICQINKESIEKGQNTIVNQKLNFQNGLVSNEFNTGAYYKDKDGLMYFGGIDGINWFDPSFMLKNRKPTKIIFLTLATSNDGHGRIISLHDKEEIRLNYKNRDFQIRYSELNFSQKESVQFQYKLQNYNSEWIDNGNSRLINFSNVPPGEYVFQLKATNQDGIWNIRPDSFKLVIIPAIWQTWWFTTIALGLLILGIWYLVNLRISAIKRTADLKQDLVQSESKALRSQMNPHFLFNSLNAIDNYILNHDPHTASDYLSKFSKLIRQILDYSNLSEISLSQEIEILSLYVKMEQMRFPSKFEFDMQIDPSIDPDEISVPPLIIQPYVENAIWHGLMHIEYDGQLTVKINKEDGYLSCSVIDNGIGRTKAKEIKSKSATRHKSHGMQITQERIKLIGQIKNQGGDIFISDGSKTDGSGPGTTVLIRFPI